MLSNPTNSIQVLWKEATTKLETSYKTEISFGAKRSLIVQPSTTIMRLQWQVCKIINSQTTRTEIYEAAYTDYVLSSSDVSFDSERCARRAKSGNVQQKWSFRL